MLSDDVAELLEAERTLQRLSDALEPAFAAASRLDAIDHPGAGAVRDQLAELLGIQGRPVDGSIAAALLHLEEFRLARTYFDSTTP